VVICAAVVDGASEGILPDAVVMLALVLELLEYFACGCIAGTDADLHHFRPDKRKCNLCFAASGETERGTERVSRLVEAGRFSHPNRDLIESSAAVHHQHIAGGTLKNAKRIGVG